MIDQDRLCEKAAACGLDVRSIAPALDAFAQLLVSYNEKVNLTAITDPEGIEDRHFIDSLLLARQPEVRGALVDVGTGAGFPGIVVKLYRPDIRLTLMEPTGKRCDFLRYACAELGVEADIVKERAEEAARKQWRERFDTATARAVAGMRELSEFCLPLVKTGGFLLAMKGSSACAEAEEARGAMAKLGGKLLETRTASLPDGSARGIVVCEKISQTPPVYPRNGGKIAKAPLG